MLDIIKLHWMLRTLDGESPLICHGDGGGGDGGGAGGDGASGRWHCRECRQ